MGERGNKISTSKKGFTTTAYVLTFGIILLLLVSFSMFAQEFTKYVSMKPALCVDGQERSQLGTGEAHFVVDDSKVWANRVHMRCGVPVALYPCSNSEATTTSDCNASTNASSKWPARILETAVRCVQTGAESMGPDHCDQASFGCGDFPCNAYEKTKLVCKAQMKQEEYLCYHSPGHETTPVDVEKTSVGIVAAWGGLACASLFTALYTFFRGIFFTFEAEKKKGFRPDKKARQNCATVMQIILQVLVIIGILYAVVWIIEKITGAGEEQPINPALYVALESKMFPINGVNMPINDINVTHTLVPEEPLPDSLQWWHILFVGCGSFCGCLCSVFGCRMWALGECAKSKEYRLEQDSSSSEESSDESESESEPEEEHKKLTGKE